MALESTGEYASIDALLTRALAIREKTLGPADIELGKSLTNLGRLRHFQRRYEQAEPLYQRALAVQRAGGEHANEIAIANALHDLAILYRDLKAYDKAAPYLEQELEIWETRFGIDHPLAIPLLDLYADVLKRTGNPRKAEALENQAARSRATRDAQFKKPE
jgi:tetratricopeptide (TPR) repeat protein